ncbi:acetyl-CoA carboxylase biotin carboxyl carrier protein [Microlunatus parietis]|uniref:Biotin carboxyl carrier protein of acetyl-CoA carboxylase n=1 Tax=Microlunatus parietis TaxID=682979 RepID=A0A7Y9IA72_9ACTN|nr:biotin/lipoyl-containing protein [Microlunatus parietis]NYE73119.1 acetyl-CoA carboxylase biotin carboxyl carrier protein [Microlunatus parietis]
MTTEPDESTLRLLREEVSSLVKTVPGPVSRVSVRAGECSLEVTWADPAPVLPDGGPAPAPAARPVAAVPVEDEPEPDGEVIPAPLVGTFYVAPEPGASPFVRPGDRVEAGQTIGIIEAMKLMNPVAADRPGEVVEVLVADAAPVEFGQPLVRVREAAS